MYINPNLTSLHSVFSGIRNEIKQALSPEEEVGRYSPGCKDPEISVVLTDCKGMACFPNSRDPYGTAD